MAPDAIVFALANPDPEVHPDVAAPVRRAWWPPGAATSRTRSTTCWRSPGIFKGALSVRATRITEGMKLAAAEALADVRRATGSPTTTIIPSVFDPLVAPTVAAAVARRRATGSAGARTAWRTAR